MRLRSAVSLVETVLAVLLFSVIGIATLQTVRHSQIRADATSHRVVALTLAKGQIEKIRAAGPMAYNMVADTFTTNNTGVRGVSGPYHVGINREVNCLPGVPSEKTSSLAPGSCTGQTVPMVTYKVDVSYPDKSAAQSARSNLTLSYSFDDKAIGAGVCNYPQVWLGSACGCPGGETYNATYNTCDCPAGQSWNGTSCQATTCQPSQYQTRSDCAGGQIGSSTWREDPDPATCASGAWYQVNRTCSCPSGLTWNGANCACPAGESLVGGVCTCTAPASQSWTAPCTGGRTGAIQFTAPATSCGIYGAPVADYSQCACPGGTSWDGTSCVSAPPVTPQANPTAPYWMVTRQVPQGKTGVQGGYSYTQLSTQIYASYVHPGPGGMVTDPEVLAVSTDLLTLYYGSGVNGSSQLWYTVNVGDQQACLGIKFPSCTSGSQTTCHQGKNGPACAG